ncbi:MAG: hypothetical protein Q8N63_03135 [Nanoarchaeota archaeon]|nr:hypothetical protein [Nanoarchaeota archaeon]
MEIEQIHDCEACHGKIVCIETDKLGNSFCGYCHARADYSKLLDNEDFKRFIKKLQEKNEKEKLEKK